MFDFYKNLCSVFKNIFCLGVHFFEEMLDFLTKIYYNYENNISTIIFEG